MSSLRALFLLAGLSVVASACGPELTMPYEVKEPRLFAARVEVEGDPARPRPKLGERFSIRQYLVLPDAVSDTPLESRYSVSLAVCLGLKLPNGRLACLPVSADGAVDLPLTPTIEIRSPYEIVMSDLEAPAFLAQLPEPFNTVDQLNMFGTVCVDGRAERIEGKSINEEPVTKLFRCIDNEGSPYPEQMPFTLTILLDREREGDLNHNPSFACDASEPDSACNVGVEIEDETPTPGSFVLVYPRPKTAAKTQKRESVAWEPVPEPTPWQGCAEAGVFDGPKIEAGSPGKVRLRVRFDASDRERYRTQVERYNKLVTVDKREEMIVSHAASGGKLDRYFSVLLADEVDAQAEIEVDWEPPKADDPEEPIPQGGKLVQFYFAVRDDRGGADFATRAVCVYPKGP